jgi:hypothetical protein
LAIKDHYVELVSADMPQDCEEQKDNLAVSEASLVKMYRKFTQTVNDQKKKTSDEVLKALAFKQRMTELCAEVESW